MSLATFFWYGTREWLPRTSGMLEASINLVKAAMTQMQLIARAYHRTQSVKLARTIVEFLAKVNPQRWLPT